MAEAAARLSRRRLLALAALAPVAQVHAGAQLEEPLVDAVRTALSAAVHNSAPPVPEFSDPALRAHYQDWLAVNDKRLVSRMPEASTRQEFLSTVWYEAKRAGLDVEVVLGVVQVESAFRKFAISRVGARGFMQVMPFWARLIGDGDPGVLFHTQTNLRFGCVILRHYTDLEAGDLFMALGRYNGSRGQAAYPDAVMAASRTWS
jgi:soluble lytic murein transglycosylase-like protein